MASGGGAKRPAEPLGGEQPSRLKLSVYSCPEEDKDAAPLPGDAPTGRATARPGQGRPANAPAGRSNQRPGGGASWEGASDGEQDDQPSTSGRSSAWAERQEALRVRWKHLLPRHRALALRLMRLHAAVRRLRAAQQTACAQEIVSHLATLPEDMCDLITCGHCQRKLGPQQQPVRHQPVTFMGMEAVGELSVPVWCCQNQACKKEVWLPALAAHCWPSTPDSPAVWYDVAMLDEYGLLLREKGLGATAFLKFLEAVHHLCAPPGMRYPRLSAAQFHVSYSQYLRVFNGLDDLETLGVEGTATGPLKDCWMCGYLKDAPVPVIILAEGEGARREQRWGVCLAMDGNTKLSRYAGCGGDSPLSDSCISSFYAAADKRIAALFNANKLSLADLLGRRGSRDEQAAADAEAAACTASVSCSRAVCTPQPGAKVETHGSIGTTCAHFMPARGLFIDMPTAEQHAMYLILIVAAVRLVPDLRDVYVDLACRLIKSWMIFRVLLSVVEPTEPACLTVPAAPAAPAGSAGPASPAPAAAAASVPTTEEVTKEEQQRALGLNNLLVNWMHGQGHDPACEATRSGKYAEGAGRRIGEHAEALWAITNGPAAIGRHMSRSHRRDLTESTLDAISKRKRWLLVSHMRARQLRATALAETLKDEYAALEKKCEEDPEAAILAYLESLNRSSASGPRAGDDWTVEYVLLRVRLAGYTTLAGMPAAGLLSTPQSDAEVARLDRQVKSRESSYSISATVRAADWDPGRAKYEAALEKLRSREVDRCQSAAESLAAEVRAIERQRRESGGGAAGRRFRRIAQRKRKKLRALLAELRAWRGLGGALPPAYTEKQVLDLLAGDAAPWDGEADFGARADEAGRMVAWGRRLHVKRAERDRTVEELGWLKAEVQRLVFALGATRDRITDWLVQNGRAPGPAAGATPSPPAAAAPPAPPDADEEADADAQSSASGSGDDEDYEEEGGPGPAMGFCYWAGAGDGAGVGAGVEADEGGPGGSTSNMLGATALVAKYGRDSKEDGKACVLLAQLARINGMLDECKAYGWGSA